MEKFEKLSERSKKSWFISRAITTICFILFFVVLRIFMFKEMGDIFYGTFYLIVGIISLLLLLNTFVYPWFEYKQWKYLIDEDKIIYVEGIFFTKKVIIPIVRIQHIKLKQGIINKKLKLYDMEINTAGVPYKIPNIEEEKAEMISEYLYRIVNRKARNEVLDLKAYEEKKERVNDIRDNALLLDDYLKEDDYNGI